MSNIDLGSTPNEDFDPFANDDDFADDEATNDTTLDEAAESDSENDDDDGNGDNNEEIAENTTAEQPAPKTKAATPRAPATTDSNDSCGVAASDADAAESSNPLEAAIGAAETKDAVKAKQSLYEKLPVFEYAGATENIEDVSQTFEELRIAKATDFPELADSKRVSWNIEYGKTTKSVTDAKGTTISKIKSDIENSKEFIDALKKAKDKNPVCKVKPRVTAQSKGMSAGSSYKGVFSNMNEVDAADKVISILPAKDGKVYEVRNNPLGRFITPIVGCELLSDVRAGYTPARGIPRIPMDLMMRIIAFFRYFTLSGDKNEVLVNVYWDSHDREFVVDTPEQVVSSVSVHSTENPDFHDERFIHYMDIHSHNTMRAFFSTADDSDEKATRLYTVIGRLDKFFPEIKTRISNGGKFHEINPSEIFEYIAMPFPDEWRDKVSTRKSPHKNAVVDADAFDTKSNSTHKACVEYLCYKLFGENDTGGDEW